MDRLPPFEETISASLIAATESVISPLREILRDFGVTEQQWRVLRVINDRRYADASSIAQIGLFHASSVTRIVRELEERGLVSRKGAPGDRRRSLFSLTAGGKKIVDDTSGHMGAILDGFATCFGVEKMDELKLELRALSATVKGLG